MSGYKEINFPGGRIFVSHESDSRRLVKLREYVRLLEILGKHSEEKFLKDPFLYGNAERYLQLSIQCLLDIGNHIVAEKKLGTPADYTEIIRILGNSGIIPNELVDRILPMAGLRNILVHDYLEIDRTQIYRMIREQLGNFEIFAAHIGKLL